MNYWLITLGIIVIYLALTFRYVPPPFEWVIEINIPRRKTIKKVWKPGIHFLLLPIPPFMFVRNKLFCADEAIAITPGLDDGLPGDKSKIEFQDASAAVKLQMILRVFDPIKATYEVDDYRKAAIERTESNFRRHMATMKLDDAMGDLDKRSRLTREAFIDVNRAIGRWGAIITNKGKEITIIDFILGPEVIAERQKILKAEKDRLAQIAASEAERQSTINIAEGQAARIKMLGEAEGKGEAEKVRILTSILNLDEATAMDYLLKNGMLRAVDGSTIIATSEGGTLNTPIGLYATLLGIQEANKKKQEENK